MTLLNLGCSNFKIPNFVNIDIDPSVNPELVIDLRDLSKNFTPNSVDFIYAGHVFEHFTYEESLDIMKQCQSILKPFRNLMLVVPDYSKCSSLPIEEAERIILGCGNHKTIFNSIRITEMLKKLNFHSVNEIVDLKEVPYILVSNIYDPKPEPWQTAFLAFKIF